jgi:hypothetical protein
MIYKKIVPRGTMWHGLIIFFGIIKEIDKIHILLLFIKNIKEKNFYKREI